MLSKLLHITGLHYDSQQLETGFVLMSMLMHRSGVVEDIIVLVTADCKPTCICILNIASESVGINY